MSRLPPASAPSDPARVLSAALDLLARAGAVAVCHVTEVSGSTPCRRGWKKLVTSDGNSFGNLGGGAFEAKVVTDAGKLLASGGTGRYQRYYFTEDAIRGEPTGMSCGGVAEVWIEIMHSNPVLIVCGGGPVGEALAANAAVCDFDVVVVDDREEFVDANLHSSAQTRRVEPGYSDLPLSEYGERELYVCVVSRAWETDLAALNAVLSEPPLRLRYIGLMGSRRKIEKVRASMTSPASDNWEQVEAPIGLDIGAETPAEIAVSILARLIAVRRQLPSPSD